MNLIYRNKRVKNTVVEKKIKNNLQKWYKKTFFGTTK